MPKIREKNVAIKAISRVTGTFMKIFGITEKK
jgi:hypothetical protein